MHPGQSILPGGLWAQSGRWDPQLRGAQGLRRSLGNNQKQGDVAGNRNLKAGRGQGQVAGTCGGVSGTGTFFSTKLTLAGSRNTSLTTFLWGQPTWGRGQEHWADQAAQEALKQPNGPLPWSTLSSSCSAPRPPPPGSLHDPLHLGSAEAALACVSWFTSCKAPPTTLVSPGVPPYPPALGPTQ